MNTCSYYKSLYEYLFLFAFNFLAETFLRLAETFFHVDRNDFFEMAKTDREGRSLHLEGY